MPYPTVGTSSHNFLYQSIKKHQLSERHIQTTDAFFMKHYLRFFLAFLILLAWRFIACFIINEPALPLRPPPNI